MRKARPNCRCKCLSSRQSNGNVGHLRNRSGRQVVTAELSIQRVISVSRNTNLEADTQDETGAGKTKVIGCWYNKIHFFLLRMSSPIDIIAKYIFQRHASRSSSNAVPWMMSKNEALCIYIWWEPEKDSQQGHFKCSVDRKENLLFNQWDQNRCTLSFHSTAERKMALTISQFSFCPLLPSTLVCHSC